MKVFQKCEFFLRICGLFSDSTNGYFKSINTLISTCGLLSLALMSGANVYKNITNLDESIKSFLPVFAGIYIHFSYIGVAANMRSIKILHKVLQGIVDNGKKFK